MCKNLSILYTVSSSSWSASSSLAIRPTVSEIVYSFTDVLEVLADKEKHFRTFRC